MDSSEFDVIFKQMREAGLLAICEECGDGRDEHHPINETTGECYRHGGLSIFAAEEKLRAILRGRIA